MDGEPRVQARYRAHNGGWLVTATTAAGETSAYGRTLATAREAIVRELSQAFEVYRGSIGVDDDIALATDASEALSEARQARNDALRAAAASNAATGRAAHRLHDQGLRLGDIGYLLGVSKTRVHQLLAAPPAPDTRTRRRRPSRPPKREE